MYAEHFWSLPWQKTAPIPYLSTAAQRNLVQRMSRYYEEHAWIERYGYYVGSEIPFEIRLLKFQDYIRRKPNSPFGYYGLRVQYMLSKACFSRENVFSCTKDRPSLYPSQTGQTWNPSTHENIWLQPDITKNADCFMKNIYTLRIGRATSQLYCSRSFSGIWATCDPHLCSESVWDASKDVWQQHRQPGGCSPSGHALSETTKRRREGPWDHRSCVQMPGSTINWDGIWSKSFKKNNLPSWRIRRLPACSKPYPMV